MGNLGFYQKMTTMAKKVGGPVKLVAILMASGYVVGKGIEIGAKGLVKGVKKKKASRTNDTSDRKGYVVKQPGTSNEGLEFATDDIFYVLERDGDAVLIEKDGDESNPYFVSGKFLSEISDYPEEKQGENK